MMSESSDSSNVGSLTESTTAMMSDKTSSETGKSDEGANSGVTSTETRPTSEATEATPKKNISWPNPSAKSEGTSTNKSFKEIVEEVMAHKRVENSATQTADASIDGSWEPSLTYDEEELKALEELGLGVAVDITAKHPWVSKSAFRAKSVSTKDLIVINESNKFHKSREHVETYSDIQAGLESSFRPDPSKPINVTVAADFHRSNTRSKTIDSQTLLTRTIAFRAKDPASKDESKNCFELNLHKWLVKEGCYPQCDKHYPNLCKCHSYADTTNHHCICYLKELGGVTHYVSSITLGATKYHVSLNSTVFSSFSSSSGVSADTLLTASTRLKGTRKVFQAQSKVQRIGKIPNDDSNILQFRTKGEAVVKCSYHSLANLVSHPQLRCMLERGIHEYIDSRKNGTRGPYHIATAELLPWTESPSSPSRKRLYWNIDWTLPRKEDKDSSNGFRIKYTPNESDASNFYLKPAVALKGGDKYFHIVTDPEDDRGLPSATCEAQTSKDQAIGEQAKASQSETSTVQRLSPPQASLPGPDKVPRRHVLHSQLSQSERILEPQRYVSVLPDNTLVVELDIKRYKKNRSVFKVKHPQTGKTHPLSKSQWLPEALLGSQPYIIGLEGNSHTSQKRKKTRSVHINRKKGSKSSEAVVFGSHTESYFKYSYFILETGHPT